MSQVDNVSLSGSLKVAARGNCQVSNSLHVKLIPFQIIIYIYSFCRGNCPLLIGACQSGTKYIKAHARETTVPFIIQQTLAVTFS
jgi:hypothetical protein